MIEEMTDKHCQWNGEYCVSDMREQQEDKTKNLYYKIDQWIILAKLLW